MFWSFHSLADKTNNVTIFQALTKIAVTQITSRWSRKWDLTLPPERVLREGSKTRHGRVADIEPMLNINQTYRKCKYILPLESKCFPRNSPPPRVLRTIIAVDCIALKQWNKLLHNIQRQQLSRTYNLWGSWPWIVRTHLELQPRFEAKKEKRENKKTVNRH